MLSTIVPILAAAVPQDPSRWREPLGTAVILGVFGALVGASVLLSRWANRAGLPVVLLFLGLGMLGGSEGIGGLYFDNYALAFRVGTLALVLILFDGGLNTSVGAIRQAIAPAATLATFGVLITAGLVALFARWLGLAWGEALLLGAVISPTDAAAVFSLLRGSRLELSPRPGHAIEVESCVNDPTAVILTAALIDVITGHGQLGWGLLLAVPLELAIGTIIGLLAGFGGRALLRRASLTASGLYPALTLSVALVSFAGATLVHGSGFLAVFVAGVVLGAGAMPYRSGLARVHDALAWLSQIVMFLVLGLLVFPSRLPAVAGVGLAVALFLAVIARPVAVGLSLLPFRFPWRESAYVGWVGLRGAVPVILATFPVLAHVPGAERVFDIVFFVVVVNSLLPGATVPWVTRLLRTGGPAAPSPAAAVEINSAHPLGGELSAFHITPTLAVCGATLAEVEFPAGSAVVLVARGPDLIAARGDTRLLPGDHAYVYARPAERGYVQLLFGKPQDG